MLPIALWSRTRPRENWPSTSGVCLWSSREPMSISRRGRLASWLAWLLDKASSCHGSVGVTLRPWAVDHWEAATASHLVFRQGDIAISNASPCKLTRGDVVGLGRQIYTSKGDPFDELAYMLVGGVFRVSTIAEVGVDNRSLPGEPMNPSHGYRCHVRCSGHAYVYVYLAHTISSPPRQPP
ncbi:hypothetical protein F4808DRAFT_180309 [Astrocystis sublimbata]|nr:hypothetical protein F4808DRAFT_180309 [Astrocystis sublimbata]